MYFGIVFWVACLGCIELGVVGLVFVLQPSWWVQFVFCPAWYFCNSFLLWTEVLLLQIKHQRSQEKAQETKDKHMT